MLRPCPKVLPLDQESVSLVERWRAGDQQAATELFRRYAGRLIALARSRLRGELTARVDPEDVVQSACRSFFVGVRAGDYELEQEGDLWGLLVAITLHKLQHQVAYHKAQKRGGGAGPDFGSENSLFGLQPQALAREPSPLEALTLIEQLEQLVKALDPWQRQVLELRLQGYQLAEIALKTGKSLRTTCRAIEQIKQQLSSNVGDEV
jgi:RNA polymerase sigma factor (sigma-70 family)